MQAAIEQSGRRNFVRQCLFMLWPSTKPLLLSLTRQLGDEIRLPEDDLSLLCRSILTGVDRFRADHRRDKKRCLLGNTADWDLKVFISFLAATYQCAADIGYCRVATVYGCTWTVEQQPYMDWRREHPGQLQVAWEWDSEPVLGAEQLVRLTMQESGAPKNWASKMLLALLA